MTLRKISRTIVKVGFNGKSRMLCLSIWTAVYMDMTACRPEKSLGKHFFVLHMPNFSQVKNRHDLYLLDKQVIAFLGVLHLQKKQQVENIW